MRVQVTYYDTAMVLIEIGGLRLLTDPVLDAAGATFDYGAIRLEKTNEASTTAEAIGRLDAVLLSHDQHGDNLDESGRELLKSAPLVVTTPVGAERLAGVARGLKPWESLMLTGTDGFELRVTAAPAQHGPDGTQELTGPVTGFLLDWDGRVGDGPIYISGDTVPFSGTQEIVERAAPIGLALLHLGHVKPEGVDGVYLSLSAAEAAHLAQNLDAGAIVPLHFDGWKHFSEAREDAKRTLDQSAVGSRVHWLTSGETFALDM